MPVEVESHRLGGDMHIFLIRGNPDRRVKIKH
jgi:hypothetical protein